MILSFDYFTVLAVNLSVKQTLLIFNEDYERLLLILDG